MPPLMSEPLTPPPKAEPRKRSTEELFPLVYDELRRLAAQKLAQETPGQTLQPTALVHEAFLRLEQGASTLGQQQWESRTQFFCAAAEAMRRILVDSARRKNRPKHGGDMVRHDVACLDACETEDPALLLDIHEALSRLEAANAAAAEIVKLRYFAGFTNKEAAAILEISPRKGDQLWAYAKAWLLDAIGGGAEEA
jgi:RNA polymerase sigma factor (TIGR02999 family)